MSTEHPRADRCINYIEFNVSDIDRSKAFYGSAFGWTFTDYGPSYCEFSDGHMTGGFDATAPVGAGGPLVVLYGSDLADIQTAIEAAGGQDRQTALRISRRAPLSLYRSRWLRARRLERNLRPS